MKTKQRFLSALLMAIVMMAMSPTKMWAETKNVSTYDELVTVLAAANDDDVINLTADITVSGDLTIGKKVTFQGQKLTVGSNGSVLASAQVTFKNAVEASKIKQYSTSYKGQLRYTTSGNRMIFQGAVESKTISGGLFRSGATISTDLVDGGTFNNGIIPKPRTEGDKILKGGTFYTKTGLGLVEIYNMLGEGYELFANIASTNYISIKEASTNTKTAKITRTNNGNDVTLYSETLTKANSFAVSGDVIELIAEDNSNITLADGVTFKVPTTLSYTGTVSSGVEGKIVLSKSDDGYTTYSLADEAISVSKDGVTTKYASLEDAFAAATDGSTIKLCQDVTIQNSSYAILINYEKYPTAGLTIDLGQKKLTLERTGYYGGEAINILEGNKITIKNGTLDVNKYGVGINAVSPLTLDGVTVDGTDLDQTIMGPYDKTLCTIQSIGTDIVLNNSIITAPSGQYSYYSGNYSEGNALTINGTSTMDGKINLHNCIMKAASTASITNCTLYADDNSVGTLSIKDGTFTAPTGYDWKAGTDGLSLLYSSSLALSEYVDPTAQLQTLADANVTQDITLAYRTLYKDGYYNTLCLPFSLTAEQLAASPLAGCTLKEVTGASISGEGESKTMTIELTEATAIEAGKPYLIKWANDTENPTITSPTFTGVTITKSEPSTITGTNLDVVGIFAPKTMATSDTDLFFLGAENKFYTSNSETGANLKGYRCFFKQKSASDGKALNIVLDDEATGISELIGESLEVRDGKYLENGCVVIMRNGKKYNVNGQIIK